MQSTMLAEGAKQGIINSVAEDAANATFQWMKTVIVMACRSSAMEKDQ